ncbi:PilN domain-containing protein [Candidatus Omnitrophota bacterium]
MIEIDLLPANLRQKSKFSFNLQPALKMKIVFIVLGGVILLQFFLSTIVFINNKRIAALKNNRQKLAPQKQQLDQLRTELSALNSRMPLIEGLFSQRVIWSEKLNRISDLMVAGVWLREIDLQTEQQKGQQVSSIDLIIRGSAASQAKDEPALIGKFMQNLKDDSVFSGDFSDIELGPIKKRKIAETEVMDFILNCRFRPERLEALIR